MATKEADKPAVLIIGGLGMHMPARAAVFIIPYLLLKHL